MRYSVIDPIGDFHVGCRVEAVVDIEHNGRLQVTIGEQGEVRKLWKEKSGLICLKVQFDSFNKDRLMCEDCCDIGHGFLMYENEVAILDDLHQKSINVECLL